MFSDKLEIKVKIATIDSIKGKVYDVLLGLSRSYINDNIIKLQDIKTLYRALLPAFPVALQGSDLFQEALHRSLENYLVGHTLDTEVRSLLSIRLAGNLRAMKMGKPITFPLSKTTDEHCLSRVVASTQSNCGERFSMSLELITGPTAGEIIEFSTTSRPMLRRVMIVAGLYSREERMENIFINPTYMYGCYLFIRPIETEGMVFVKDLGTSSSLKARNRKLHNSRNVRRDCARDFEWACAVCPVGEEGCPLATHRLNAVKGKCPMCGENEWLNPEVQDLMSFECQNVLL